MLLTAIKSELWGGWRKYKFLDVPHCTSPRKMSCFCQTPSKLVLKEASFPLVLKKKIDDQQSLSYGD